MGTIISASRRTDIPAFGGESFYQAVKKGEILVPNPFNNKDYCVSLAPEHVDAIVFWSRNYTPFLPVLRKLRDLYKDRFIFHFTITGYQGRAKQVLEPRVPSIKQAIACINELSEEFGAEKVFWRYDPIVISDLTSKQERVQTFAKILAEIRPAIQRCYFSFVDLYSKVKSRFQRSEERIKLAQPGKQELLDFASDLYSVANKYDLPLLTCCEDWIARQTEIKKGHCVDAQHMQKLFPPISFTKKIKPTRPECGCYASRDIGTYNTCQYNCLYCYANK